MRRKRMARSSLCAGRAPNKRGLAMTRDLRSTRRRALTLTAGAALGAVTPARAAPAQDKARAFAALPDWTGIWTRRGNLFDPSGGAPNAGTNERARDYPPYKPAWEAAYSKFFMDV